MKILLIALISIIIGLFLYFNVRGKLDKKKGLILGALCAVCVIIALIYTLVLDKKNHIVAEIIAAFQRGETIQCGEIAVNSADFTFTNGTLSFMGKVGSKYERTIIAIEECE